MVQISASLRKKSAYTLAAIGLFTAGAFSGSVITRATRPVAIMAAVKPTPIAALSTLTPSMLGATVVTVKGKVAEIYGNRIILQDGSGKTLIDLKPGRTSDDLVAIGQQISIQGRVDRNGLRPLYLEQADGTIVALNPMRGHHGHRFAHDRREDRSPPMEAQPEKISQSGGAQASPSQISPKLLAETSLTLNGPLLNGGQPVYLGSMTVVATPLVEA